MAPANSLPAFDEAFSKLKQSVSPTDAVIFQSTTIQDVWKEALDIQRYQRERSSLQNLKRIEPLLKGLEKYSKVIEVLCNGTPYLPWIWAPIKLLLQLASGHANVFEKLLDAYARIAESMPRFDRLQHAFEDDPNFKNALSMVYADILEFHLQAYKFFRRRGWHVVFDSLWKDFNSRFSGILESLSRHSDLVDREVSSIDIAEARSARIRAEEDIIRREKERQTYRLQDSMSWLAVNGDNPEEELERLLRRRQPGTCEWFCDNSQISSWISDSKRDPIIWLKGIPGAGKSVLCAHLIDTLNAEKNCGLIYYFCNSNTDGKDLCTKILKSLALQILKGNTELASHVADRYASLGLTASLSQVRKLLPELLGAVAMTRIVIDGLDECPSADQKLILQELLLLMKWSADRCKLLFSTRENATMSRAMSKRPIIFLSENDKRENIDTDIKLYVHEELAVLRDRFEDAVMDDVEKMVVRKANGMFLYVRLVIAELVERHSLQDLQMAAISLPEGLDEAYGRILERINKLKEHSRRTSIRILKWMACSFRPLKSYEIQDGLALSPGTTVLSDVTKLSTDILDHCKPLIEKTTSNTIDFVHFSAKEYILHPGSGPYLQENEAHFDIAFSCISYLASSFYVSGNEMTDVEFEERILRGYHGLHSYASEFWIHHLLRFSKAKKGFSQTELEALVTQLTYLCKSHKTFQSTGDIEALSEVEIAPYLREGLSMWESFSNIVRFLEHILIFRHTLSQEKSAMKSLEDFKAFELENDPTFATSISYRYQEIMDQLLHSSEADQKHQLHLVNQFREVYGGLGFTCRFYQCARRVDGFQTIQERDQHESLHARRFRCGDTSCEFSSHGFSSKGALQSHTRKYHGKATDEAVPVLRRKKAQILKEADLNKEDFAPIVTPRSSVILVRDRGPPRPLSLQEALTEVQIDRDIIGLESSEEPLDEGPVAPAPSLGGSGHSLSLLFPASVASKQFPPMPIPEVLEKRKRALSSLKTLDTASKKEISEYWRASELSAIPSLLGHFGSNWNGIAAWMGTKTAEMIKDHLESQVEPNLSKYKAILADRDEKIANNEPTDPLPDEIIFENRVYSHNSPQPLMPHIVEPQYEICLPYRPADPRQEIERKFVTEVFEQEQQATPSLEVLILMCIDE